jgi:hypothetical protein
MLIRNIFTVLYDLHETHAPLPAGTTRSFLNSAREETLTVKQGTKLIANNYASQAVSEVVRIVSKRNVQRGKLRCRNL